MIKRLQTWEMGLLKAAAGTDARSHCREVVKNPMSHARLKASRSQAEGWTANYSKDRARQAVRTTLSWSSEDKQELSACRCLDAHTHGAVRSIRPSTVVTEPSFQVFFEGLVYFMNSWA